MKPQLLRKLNESGTTWMIMNEEDGRLYVHKTIASTQIPIYSLLMNNKIPHVPKVSSIEVASRGQSEVVYLDFIEGVTIRYLISHGHTFTKEEAKLILLELCETLAELHKLGIVHCDINPANVLISTDGNVYLLDYDVARIIGVEVPARMRYMGTEGFASPEQQAGMEVDVRMDIYSLGRLADAILNNLDGLEKCDELRRLIAKCTEEKVHLRCDNIQELMKELDNFFV